MYYNNTGLKIAQVAVNGKIIPVNGKIYWHIENFTPDMDKYKVILAFEQAFKILQPYVKPIFTSTSKLSESQITLKFRNNTDSDLDIKFDANVLAYAYLANNTTAYGDVSDVFFNELHKWAEMHGPNQFNLKSVTVHELLHALGLHHSTDRKDILYPSYPNSDVINLTQDTIDSIYKLYGVPEVPGTKEEKPIFSFSSLFRNKAELMDLREDQLLVLAHHLGIEATVKDTKSNTSDKILKIIGNG